MSRLHFLFNAIGGYSILICAVADTPLHVTTTMPAPRFTSFSFRHVHATRPLASARFETLNSGDFDGVPSGKM